MSYIDKLLKELKTDMDARPSNLSHNKKHFGKKPTTTDDLLQELNKEMGTNKFVDKGPAKFSEDNETLLRALKQENPPDPRLEYLDSFEDELPSADYQHLKKMIHVFDLSKEELDEELSRYGIL